MRNRFSLDDNEKQRILSLHENAIKNQYLNVIVEQTQEWLTFPGDKNYTYQKQNDKWVAKNKAGKVFDMSKYPSSVAKLEKQFPGGKSSTNVSSTAETPTNVSVTNNTQQVSVKNETLPGAPVYYPWIQDGKVSFDKLKQTLKSDPNLQNWYSNLTKLNLEQIKKVEKDFLSNGFPQSSTPQFPFEGSTSPTLVVRSIIQDATKIIEKNSQQG